MSQSNTLTPQICDLRGLGSAWLGHRACEWCSGGTYRNGHDEPDGDTCHDCKSSLAVVVAGEERRVLQSSMSLTRSQPVLSATGLG